MFDFDAAKYLPMVCTYLDDIIVEAISDWSGELLAINEFNESHPLRKIAPFPFLREKTHIPARALDRADLFLPYPRSSVAAAGRHRLGGPRHPQ